MCVPVFSFPIWIILYTYTYTHTVYILAGHELLLIFSYYTMAGDSIIFKITPVPSVFNQSSIVEHFTGSVSNVTNNYGSSTL